MAKLKGWNLGWLLLRFKLVPSLLCFTLEAQV